MGSERPGESEAVPWGARETLGFWIMTGLGAGQGFPGEGETLEATAVYALGKHFDT